MRAASIDPLRIFAALGTPSRARTIRPAASFCGFVPPVMPTTLRELDHEHGHEGGRTSSEWQRTRYCRRQRKSVT